MSFLTQFSNRTESPSQGTESLYTAGETDASFGRLPEFADAGYLEGYVAQLKKLPQDETGRIRHYTPRQHFAFGYVETPDPCFYD
jgi:hypothetical protein